MPNNTLRCPHDYISFAPEVVQKAYASYMVNIIMNAVLCLPTAIANTLVIVAVLHSPTLRRRPSILLICNMAFTDLGVGLVAQPLHAASRAAELVGDFSLYCTTWLVSRMVGRWLSNASLYTLVAISVDRVLAIHLKTRYRTIVNWKTVTAGLVVLWCLAAMVASVRFFATVGKFLLVLSCSNLMCLAVILTAYVKSFQALRQHQNRIQQQDGRGSTVNVVTYKRLLNTMLIILGVCLLCYLPHICLGMYLAFTGRNPVERAAWTIVDLLVFANSFFNPLLYYWRLPSLRQVMWSTLTCDQNMEGGSTNESNTGGNSREHAV